MTAATSMDLPWPQREFAAGDPRVAWVDALLERFAPSRYAIAILVLCVGAAMAEGYDTSVMALAAPMIGAKWSLTPRLIGLLLSASILGAVIGSFLLSPIGDKWGRRPAILVALALVGLATLSGGLVVGPGPLLVTRLLSGLGLGMAVPNVIALAMELMPAGRRSMAVVLVSCGIPLGTTVGGLIVARLIGPYGYPAIFLAGGIATLAIMAVCLVALPESPLILVRVTEKHAQLGRLLRRLGTELPTDVIGYSVCREPQPRQSVRALFVSERGPITMILWIMNFANLGMAYYLFTWLPSIVAATGATPQFTILSLSAFNAGGLIGGLIIAFSLSRLRPTTVLCIAYVVAMITTVALTEFHLLGSLFLIILGSCGAVVGGSQFCLNAVVNQSYPSAIRATACGYATGVGRLAALAAPTVGAAVMSDSSLKPFAFGIAALPAAVALAAVLLLRRQTAGLHSAELRA